MTGEPEFRRVFRLPRAPRRQVARELDDEFQYHLDDDGVPDIVEDDLSQTAKDFGSDDLIGIPVDVTSFDSLCALRDKTIDHFGGVHVIVNNAAVGAGAKGSVWEHHLNDWKWSLDVNVLGVITESDLLEVFVRMLSSTARRTGTAKRKVAPAKHKAASAKRKAAKKKSPRKAPKRAGAKRSVRGR